MKLSNYASGNRKRQILTTTLTLLLKLILLDIKCNNCLISWDQMGDLDIPAMVEKILTTTGHSKIHYVGHSMGTTGFMVAINKHPELAEKVSRKDNGNIFPPLKRS